MNKFEFKLLSGTRIVEANSINEACESLGLHNVEILSNGRGEQKKYKVIFRSSIEGHDSTYYVTKL